MKKLKSLLTISSCFFILSACTAGLPDEDEKSLGQPSETPLEGKVSGNSWFFQSGVFRQDLQNPNHYAYFLYESKPTSNLCNYTPPTTEKTLYFSVPKMIGTYVLGSEADGDAKVVFLTPSGAAPAKPATEGSVIVQMVNETSAVGKLNARADDDNVADGKFAVQFCR